MGWANGDREIVVEGRICLSKTKSVFYDLDKVFNRIVHTEKRIALLKYTHEIGKLLDRIEQDLYR